MFSIKLSLFQVALQTCFTYNFSFVLQPLLLLSALLSCQALSTLPLMSRIELKYCLIATSCLAGLSGIFILLHIWHNCVCFGVFSPMRTSCDGIWIWIWISLAFNPGHICTLEEFELTGQFGFGFEKLAQLFM